MQPTLQTLSGETTQIGEFEHVCNSLKVMILLNYNGIFRLIEDLMSGDSHRNYLFVFQAIGATPDGTMSFFSNLNRYI